MVQCDFIVLTEHLQYTKRSPVNISAPLGDPDSRLRIPVSHKPLFESIYLKQVDDHNNWRKRHYKTILHKFHNFPYGYYYLPQLEDFYNGASSNLSDLLFKLLQKIVGWLHLDLELHQSGKFDVINEPHNFVKFWQDKLKGAKYLITKEMLEKEWLNQDTFNQNKIRYNFYSGYPTYHILNTYKDQSIINFFMQFGPEAGYLLKYYM